MRHKTLRRRTARTGFTLLELLLVMAILIVLASLAGVAVMNMRAGALVRAATIEISTIEDQCKAYELNVGRPPTSLNDLRTPPSGVSQALWGAPYLDKDPVDPWGNEYQFNHNAQTNEYRVSSNGKDGRAGTDDDVPVQGL